MPTLTLTLDSGETSLSVSRFSIHEATSSLFTVSIWALSDDPSLDLDSVVGRAASFRAESGFTFAVLGGARLWSGICNSMQLARAESVGKSTYQLTIVPTLWLLTQRRGHRIYQNLAIPDIADLLLNEWQIKPVWKIDRPSYPNLEYKVQYGESDFDFLSRLLEEAGITFTFPDDAEHGSRLTFHDKLHEEAPRAAPPIPYDHKGGKAKELVTEVRLGHDVRPGAYTVRDFDFRNPAFALLGEATKAAAPEDRYEQFEYSPGAFVVAAPGARGTPAADDRGAYRYDQPSGAALAQRTLDAERVRKLSLSFATNTVDLWPGVVFSIEGHPHPELSAGQGLLVTQFFLDGTPGGLWQMSGTAVFTEVPYRSPWKTPRPQIQSMQSATVVGPTDQEIHTDEHGRVRVQFPWDREGNRNDSSSPWIRVSEGWAGTGFGLLTLPRVGQEVLVGFLGGDPEQPIVVGRLFNTTNPVPNKLPENKTRSDWKSNSTPGADGWNEIMFEDLAGNELVYAQAQRNQRRLVKHDETITVGNDREKNVTANETDTTIGNRTERTVGDRLEDIAGSRTTSAAKLLARRVEGDEIERNSGSQTGWVGKDRHVIVKKTKRELVEMDLHLKVKGSLNESAGSHSHATSSQQEKVGQTHSQETGVELHEKAGTVFIAEGAADVTLVGPGGFIRIDPSGVTITGLLVKINAGGSAGSAGDAKPGGPEKPKDDLVPAPKKPEADDKKIDPAVTIGRVIRGNPYVASSAAVADGMADSVPPTKTYEVQITVTPSLEPGRFLVLDITGGNAANGTATVTPGQISTTTVVTVKGGTQTGKGNGGKLKLRAMLDGVSKAESAGFTVCSHPIDYSDTFSSDVNDGSTVGVVVQDGWKSDSGTFTDLDQTKISEIVQQGPRTVPPFLSLANTTIKNSDYLAGDVISADSHTIPVPDSGPAGTSKKFQMCMFLCFRCGVNNKDMPNSGFTITHTVLKIGAKWTHRTTKVGSAVTMGARKSAAGVASVTSLDHALP